MVYLLHLDTPLKHAKHYIGTCQDLEKRLARHREGQGARMLAVCNEQGITYQVVRTWEGGRQEELRIKARKAAPRLCPICSPKNRRAKTL